MLLATSLPENSHNNSATEKPAVPRKHTAESVVSSTAPSSAGSPRCGESVASTGVSSTRAAATSPARDEAAPQLASLLKERKSAGGSDAEGASRYKQIVPETGGEAVWAESGAGCLWAATRDYYYALVTKPRVVLTGLWQLFYETIFYFEKDQPIYLSECVIAFVKLFFFPIMPLALCVLCKYFLYAPDEDKLADIIQQGWASYLSIQVRREMICMLDASARYYCHVRDAEMCGEEKRREVDPTWRKIGLKMWDKEWWYFAYRRNAVGVPEMLGRCGGKLPEPEKVFASPAASSSAPPSVPSSAINLAEAVTAKLALHFDDSEKNKQQGGSSASSGCGETREKRKMRNFILKQRMSFHGRGHFVVREHLREGPAGEGKNSDLPETYFEVKEIGAKSGVICDTEKALYDHLNNFFEESYLLYRFANLLPALGTHAMRLTTFRLGKNRKAQLVYAYFTHSKGDTTADVELNSAPTYYEIDWERNQVGRFIEDIGQKHAPQNSVTGAALPGLQEAARMACELHDSMPESHSFLGHDLALTEDGPVFFETNAADEGFCCMSNWLPELGSLVVRSILEHCGRGDGVDVDWEEALKLETEGEEEDANK